MPNAAQQQASAQADAIMRRIGGGGGGGGGGSFGGSGGQPGSLPVGMLPRIPSSILNQIQGPPGGGGMMPGGDTTARPMPGDHIGASETGQGSLLDQVIASLTQNQNRSFPPGGHPASFTTDGQSEPMGLSEVAGMPGLGNQVDAMGGGQQGSGMDGIAAIIRRLVGNSAGIANAGPPDRSVGWSGPFQDPTSRTEGVMGANSEYGRNEGQFPSGNPLMDAIRSLVQGKSNNRIEEDSPLFNPATMGNRMGRK